MKKITSYSSFLYLIIFSLNAIIAPAYADRYAFKNDGLPSTYIPLTAKTSKEFYNDHGVQYIESSTDKRLTMSPSLSATKISPQLSTSSPLSSTLVSPVVCSFQVNGALELNWSLVPGAVAYNVSVSVFNDVTQQYDLLTMTTTAGGANQYTS